MSSKGIDGHIESRSYHSRLWHNVSVLSSTRTNVKRTMKGCAHIKPRFCKVRQDGIHSPSDSLYTNHNHTWDLKWQRSNTYLHHMVRFIHSPYQQLFVCSFAFCPKLLAIRGREGGKGHRESVAILPKVFSGSSGTDTNVTATTIRQIDFGWLQKFWMPKTEQQTRGKFGFPVRLSRDDLVHE